MRLSVARLRHFATALLILSPFVECREKSLFTSSVSYCSPPEAILISQFDVKYFADNSSVFFNVSAASVEKDANVTANLYLNVYGLTWNFTINLCDVLSGALCPLPQYQLNGSETIQLPSSLDVSSRVPGIAYQVPDLEAFAQLKLNEVSTGDLKACVQSTLSNGWSTHQPGVEWATGAVAILAFLSAIWHSIIPESLAPFRFLDLIYLYQAIATSAFLDLNYSSLYRAFTLNFSWAMGLFPMSFTSSMQNSINNMRHKTGGHLADSSSGNAVSLVNRRLSPYNQDYVVPESLIAKAGALPSMDFVKGFIFPSAASPRNTSVLATRDVATVTTDSDNVLQAGIPIYVNSVGISTGNAFMTIFLVVLIMIAIASAALAVGYGLALLLTRSRWGQRESVLEFEDRYSAFARAWGLRLAFLAFSPVVIFTFYQWTLKDSWLAVLLSVIMFLVIVAYVLWPSFVTLRLARDSSPFALYTHTDHLQANGPLYAQYRNPRYYFFAPLIVGAFLKALFVSFAKASGTTQVIALIIIEFAVFVAVVTLKPFRRRGGDFLAGYLAIVRLICTGLMVSFIERLNVKPIPRTVIGAVIAVIWAVAVVVMFINIVVNLGLSNLWRRHKNSAQSSILEKGETIEKSRRGSWRQLPSPEDKLEDRAAQGPYPEFQRENSDSTLNDSSQSRRSLRQSTIPSQYSHYSPEGSQYSTPSRTPLSHLEPLPPHQEHF
ncbi:TRP-domain-containing protein [Gloeophyllum trabeum ATCC 11539]|uniref:TRP-domain-containing protein n=1 Tax=Gloeophyllum trabeum (strain ATCC 11539 / FP-39264 / Madison 617) TaxID=670483 RepID=S7QBR2_GLOTA|nr:TRP-domain-containing protein [Gloeophyllum trabeum ATCC 11539]EPQ57401.1 TRP-domain-containing protein [Gloeophyllum trabeum ATCC 11539]